MSVMRVIVYTIPVPSLKFVGPPSEDTTIEHFLA